MRQERERQQRQRLVAGLPAHRAHDLDDVRRVDRAVGHRHAVEEERRRERPQQEVLHRRLVAATGAGDPGQHVERQREDLQGKEHHDQVGGGRDQRHAGGGEQHQGVVLPFRRGRIPGEVVRAVDQPERGDHQQDHARHHRELVRADAAAQDHRVAVPVPQEQRGDRGGEQPQQADRQMDRTVGLAHERLVQQADDADADQDQLREHGTEDERRGLDHPSSSGSDCTEGTSRSWTFPTSVVWSCGSTCAITASVDGSMRSVRIFG